MSKIPFDELRVTADRQYANIVDRIGKNPAEVVFTPEDINHIVHEMDIEGRHPAIRWHPALNIALNTNRNAFLFNNGIISEGEEGVDNLTGFATLESDSLSVLFYKYRLARDFPNMPAEVVPGRLLHGYLCEYIVLKYIVQRGVSIYGEGATELSKEVYLKDIKKALEILSSVTEYQASIIEDTPAEEMSHFEKTLLENSVFDESYIDFLKSKAHWYKEVSRNM